MSNDALSSQPIDEELAAGVEQHGGPEAMDTEVPTAALTADAHTAALSAATPFADGLITSGTPLPNALTAVGTSTPGTLNNTQIRIPVRSSPAQAASALPTSTPAAISPSNVEIAALLTPSLVQGLAALAQALTASATVPATTTQSYAGAVGSAAGGSGAGPSAAGTGSGMGGLAVAAAVPVSGHASGLGMVHGQTRGMALTAPASAPVPVAMTGAAPLTGGMHRPRVDKRYPMPDKFTPPKDHKPESVGYVEKYVHDLKSYVLYGVPEDIPAYLTFSQTSTGTFELVQQLAAEHACAPLSIDAVCDRIMKRYMPTVDRATDARMRLLNNQVVMKQGELLSEYRARFLAELALAQGAGRSAMSEEDKMLLYRRGMTPELSDACVVDAVAQRLDTFDAVHTYAEGFETRMRVQKTSSLGRSAARALVMQTGGDAHGRGKQPRQSGGGNGGRRALNAFGPSAGARPGSDSRGGARPGSDSRGHRGGGGGWQNQGRKRGRDENHRHSNQPSTCRDMHGMLLTKAQLFTLFEDGKCWYCKERVGSPPSHTGATCPRNPDRRG